jgi:hypothetical protein
MFHGTGVDLWVMQNCINSFSVEMTFEANEP